MNDARDEALGTLLERAAISIDAEPVERLPEVLRQGSRRRAARFTAIGAAVAVFVGTVAWAGLTLSDEHAVIPANVDDWRTFGSLEEDGWIVQVPPSWRIQELGPCRGTLVHLGAIVTNADFEFRNREGALAGCGEPWWWRGFPTDGVGFAFQPYEPFGVFRRLPLTRFPLTPESLTENDKGWVGPSESYAAIRIPGEFYPVAYVRRWVGPEASPDDVAALDRLLGSLQVRGASRWTEAEGTMNVLHDEQDDYTVRYPDGWTVADENLTPWLVSPVEILSMGTLPLATSDDPEGGLRLFDAPVAPAALAALSSDDAFISLQESDDPFVGPEMTRPDHFGPLGCEDAIFGCRAENWDVPFRAWWIPFEDEGRAFYLFVAIGTEATPELSEQTWEMADSLSFDPVAP
jgi:hypothetical protein